MTILLSALAVAFSALCVWLVVRLVNQRRRWTMWAAVVVGLPALYIAAAPVRMYVVWECPEPFSTWASEAGIIYRPLHFLMDRCPALSHVWYQYMDYWP